MTHIHEFNSIDRS